ncbi:MAG: squalene/phytoene synthase family protein [Balneolaceae bacterium]
MTNISSLFRFPYAVIRPLYERTSLHRGVIDEVPDACLRRSYDICRQITRRYAKTFYMATRFLPREKQRSIFAVYGLCRYLDNLVDDMEDLGYGEKITAEDVGGKLNAFREKLIATHAGRNTADPILSAFSDVLKKYRISVDLPLELLEGVRMDLEKTRYRNFNELYSYSYKVASVVGLITSEVFGYEDVKALKYAADLGIAMQLTNILRDIREDLGRGRIYLPQDELAFFGLDETHLFKIRRGQSFKDRNFIEFMQFQVARARAYYRSADAGIPMLCKDSRLPVGVAKENYSRILDKIEKNGYQVFRQRMFLNTAEKLSVVPKLLYRHRASVLKTPMSQSVHPVIL